MKDKITFTFNGYTLHAKILNKWNEKSILKEPDAVIKILLFTIWQPDSIFSIYRLQAKKTNLAQFED